MCSSMPVRNTGLSPAAPNLQPPRENTKRSKQPASVFVRKVRVADESWLQRRSGRLAGPLTERSCLLVGGPSQHRIRSRLQLGCAVRPASVPPPRHRSMTTSPSLFLDDLAVGQTFTSASHRVEVEEIVAYARQFDPQPFHLDSAAAGAMVFRGLAARGGARRTARAKKKGRRMPPLSGLAWGPMPARVSSWVRTARSRASAR